MSGIICALPGIIKPTAAVAASWANWTTSNKDTTLYVTASASPSYVVGRGTEPILLASNDKFWFLYSNPGTPFYYEGYHTFTRSANTLSHDGRTTASSTVSINFTNANTITLESYGKFIVLNGATTYSVGTYTSSSISPATTPVTGLANIVAASDFQNHVHPNDDSQFIQCDLDGDIQLINFDNSTNTLSIATTTTAQSNKVTNAVNGSGFWTLTGSTYKFAFLYWDTSATTWKIRHYAADLTSYTDTTLNSTPNFPSTVRNFHNYRHPTNKILMVVRDTTNFNFKAFVVSWDGSNFTQNSTATIDPLDTVTYKSPNWMTGIYYLDDGVWAVNTLQNDTAGDAFVKHAVGMFYADPGNSVSNLGWIQVNQNSTASDGHVRGGVALSPNKDYAVIFGDDTTNGISATLIYR
jgi:hypothetical protein